MTGDATQVARIKAEFASRDAAWWEAIKERLARGPATSSALAIACGIDRIRGPFSTFLIKQKRTGALIVVGTQLGPSGWPNNLWTLP